MTPLRPRTHNRRAFALVLAIATIVVLLGFWAMAYRETASLIRVESSRLLSQTRAAQSVHAMTALDQALTLLEVKAPPNRQTYAYKVTIGSSNIYIVTFTPVALPGSSNTGWSVQVTPASGSPPNYLNLPTLSLPTDPQWNPSPF
ncbi:MAG: hypothetical protein ACP5XB_05620 [Isosphaeraceae bacterium]